MIAQLKNGTNVEVTARDGHFFVKDEATGREIDVSREVVFIVHPPNILPPVDPSHPKHTINLQTKRDSSRIYLR